MNVFLHTSTGGSIRADDDDRYDSYDSHDGHDSHGSHDSDDGHDSHDSDDSHDSHDDDDDDDDDDEDGDDGNVHHSKPKNCHTVDCPNGYTRVRDAAKVECEGGRCEKKQCCEAFCSYHSCPDDYVHVKDGGHKTVSYTHLTLPTKA